MKYIKYKTRAKIVLTGDDDLLSSNTASQYKTFSSNFTNGKNFKFNLNGCLNDIQLSHNARCIMEATYMPAITGINNYILLRLVTSTQDKALDTKSFLSGNPVLAVFKGTDQYILNCSEFFYNLNVPINFLSKGYIEVQLESPVVTANIDFLSSSPLNKFFLSLIIIDEDDEVTNDSSLSAPIDFKNFGQLGARIRTPKT